MRFKRDRLSTYIANKKVEIRPNWCNHPLNPHPKMFLYQYNITARQLQKLKFFKRNVGETRYLRVDLELLSPRSH